MNARNVFARHVKPGFTLFEIVLVGAFMLLVFQMVTIFGLRSLNVQQMDQARQTIRGELSYARNLAIAGKGDSPWGVAFDTNTVTRFKGSSYATRDAEEDSAHTFSGNLSIFGASEIVFTPPFGDAQASGTVSVTDGTLSSVITVNPYGTIEIQ